MDAAHPKGHYKINLEKGFGLLYKYNEQAEQMKIPYAKAMDLFFHSLTFQLLQDGEADLHCRSDLYLIDELKLEIYGKL